MTQVSSADGRLILTCDALNVGGYGSGHRVTFYQSPLPNVGDIPVYVGGGVMNFMPASGVAGSVNNLRIEGNTVNTVTLALGSKSIGIGELAEELEAGAGVATKNFILYGRIQTSGAATENFLYGIGAQLNVGAGANARNNFIMADSIVATIGAGCFASSNFVFGVNSAVTANGTFWDENVSMGVSNFYSVTGGQCRANMMFGSACGITCVNDVRFNSMLGSQTQIIQSGGGTIASNIILGHNAIVSASTSQVTNNLIFSPFHIQCGASNLQSNIILMPTGGADLTAVANITDSILLFSQGVGFPAGTYDEVHAVGVADAPNLLSHSIMFGLEGSGGAAQQVFRICQDGLQISRVTETVIAASPNTITVAQLISGYITTNVGGAVDLVLPSAADLNAHPQTGTQPFDGAHFTCIIAPKNPLDAINLAPGAGGTLIGQGAGTVGMPTIIHCIRTSAVTWDFVRLRG